MELSERETSRGLFVSGVVTVACWAIIWAALWMMAGCTSTLTNAGDVGFRYSTEFAFFHRAAKTSGSGDDNVARTNTEFPALVEWFLAGPPAEGQTVPAPPNP
jgi:hypothetical protein